MGRKSKFDKIDEWIKKEYDRETEEIEASLSNDGSFDPGKVDSEELLRRIQAQIKEQEENEAKTEKPEKKPGINRYKLRKRVAFFFVAITGIFLASMTSEANRSYLLYKVQYLIGKEVSLNEGNDVNDNIVNRKGEQEVGEEIENKLGIAVPVFQYKLEMYADDSYSIQYGDTIATIEYKYDDNIVNLRMFNKNNADIYGVDFQGKELEKIKLKKDMITIFVKEIKDPHDEEVSLAAQWEYRDGYYQLSGKVEKNEFIKVLESLIY